MSGILKKLEGGDLCSIGRADEVVQNVLNEPRLFAEVFEGMSSDNPLIRMRCSDVIQKVSVEHPVYLQPFKSRLYSNDS